MQRKESEFYRVQIKIDLKWEIRNIPETRAYINHLLSSLDRE